MSGAKVAIEFADGVLFVRFAQAQLFGTERTAEIARDMLVAVNSMIDGAVVVDCQGVKFMSSEMVGHLLVLYDACRTRNVRALLCNLDPQVRMVLDLTRVSDFVDIYDDRPAALAAAQRPAPSPETSQVDVSQLAAQAKSGDAAAQFELANCYARGTGVVQDIARSYDAYRRSAEQQYGPAEYAVGRYHAYGIHVHRDYEQAIEWYCKSAMNGCSDAQFELGLACEHGLVGDGASLPSRDAIMWYRRAAAQGHAKALEAIQRVEAVSDECEIEA